MAQTDQNPNVHRAEDAKTSFPMLLMHAAIHIAGITAVSLLFAIGTIGLDGMRSIAISQELGAPFPFVDFVLQLTLSGVIWFMIWAFVQRVRTTKMPKKVRVSGNVMTETLITLPVFCAVFILLVQICLNNMIGMLASAAVHQGARAVWLWEGEYIAGRQSPNAGGVELLDRAKAQAALIMMPVGQANFQAIKSDAKVQRLLAMVTEPNQTGSYSGGGGAGGNGDVNAEQSFYRAFDDLGFAARAPLKFAQAYSALDGSTASAAGKLATFNLVYKFTSVLPFFEIMYGSPDRFIRVERTFSFPRQLPVNPNVPGR